MDFRQIEYFLATCSYESITDAAKNLHMSQQALSRSIASLERDLNCTLFLRTAKGIEMTTEGQYLFNELSPIVTQYHEHVSLATAHLTNKPVELPFYSCPGCLLNISAKLIIDFCAENPNIKLDMHEGTDMGCEEFLRADKRNFGLMLAPEWKHKQLHDYIVIKTVPSYLFVAQDHPLANRSSVSLRELKGERMLSFGKSSYYNDILNHNLRHFDFTLKPYYESADISQLCSLVIEGRGIFICNRRIYDEFRHEKLAIVPLAERILDYEMAFVFQSYAELHPAAKKFISYVQQNLLEKPIEPTYLPTVK